MNHSASVDETGIIRVQIGGGNEYVPTQFLSKKNIGGDILDEHGFKIKEKSNGVEISLHLAISDHILGLGEKAFPVDRKRTRSTFWNNDGYIYSMYSDPLYCSIPFFIKTNKDNNMGIYVNFPGRLTIDCGIDSYDRITIEAPTKSFAFYLIIGKTPETVVEGYSRLTGFPFRMPEWALEHQISRYSYYPDEAVLTILRRYREEFGPNAVGSIYLDIDYMDNYKLFTIDKTRFAHMENFINKIHQMDVKVIPIIDPGVKVDQGYRQFKDGLGCYVETEKGEIYTGDVWPGKCAFPDFFSEDGKSYWKAEVGKFMKNGFDGIWLDMNEPSVQNEESRSMPEDVIHSLNGKKIKHSDLHNAYALMEAEATFNSMGAGKFILSRAGYSGIQKYGAIWSGDGVATYENMKLQIPLLTGLSVSGVPYVGCDLGGFSGYTSPELLLRFYQMALFFPVYRNHKSKTGNDQELFIFTRDFKDKFREILALRHAVVPHLYWKSILASETGSPIIRPLAFNYPEVESLFTVSDEYMVGKELLLAPILSEGFMERNITLPPGKWYCYENAKEYEGDDTFRYSGEIPLFQKQDTIMIAGERIFIFGNPDEKVFYKGKWVNITCKGKETCMDGEMMAEEDYVLIGKNKKITLSDLVQ